MDGTISVSGTLSKADLKRLTGSTRKGTVGPTTVYYAGVTAPIISAGVAVFARNLLANASFITSYWLLFSSTLIAAFAGICWYLIFMRWSYRNTHGRGGEASTETRLEITEDALILHRNHTVTQIGWPGVLEVHKDPKCLTIIVEDSNAILIPDRWFGDNRTAQEAFYHTLNAHAQT